MTQSPKLNRSGLILVGIAYLGFIALGIPGTLLNIAWAPEHMQKTFAVPIEAYGLLSIAGTIGYFIATFTSGRIISRLGIGKMLLISAIVTTIGLIGYAITPSWASVIAIALIMGVGSGLIDGGLNIYFAAHYSPRLMNWLHACFGVGATIGPWLMTSMITAGQSWRVGYAIVAGVYVLLTVIFFLTRTWWQTPASAPAPATAGPTTAPKQSRQVLLMPAVWIGVALFFAYGGLEVS
ncbi:MAG TPA: MFS transporter, partial [Phototrophicaceae bacterium]|nr:MFS transporter [Phototrophicaceae bacterium]